MNDLSSILAQKGSEVATVKADVSLGVAAAQLTEHRIGALVVVDGSGAVAGILSERDLVHGLAAQGSAMIDQPVASIMTAEVITATRATSVLTALAVMTRKRVRHLPVVEDGALLGIVSIGDLVKHRMERIEAEAVAMRTYIQGG